MYFVVVVPSSKIFFIPMPPCPSIQKDLGNSPDHTFNHGLTFCKHKLIDGRGEGLVNVINLVINKYNDDNI